MSDSDQTPEPEQDERILCHNCMAENLVNANFCTQCNTPLSTYAAYDPLMQISAAGDTYIKATSGKPSLMKSIGVLLIFGPVSVWGLLGTLTAVDQIPSNLKLVGTVPWWDLLPILAGHLFSFGMLLLPILVIAKLFIRPRKPKRKPTSPE